MTINPFAVILVAHHRYDIAFKQQAVRLVQAQDNPVTVIARELGMPTKTLYKGLAAVKADPAEPFVGRGRLRAEDQQLRDLQRRIHDLAEEHAILKKPANNSQVKRPNGSGIFGHNKATPGGLIPQPTRFTGLPFGGDPLLRDGAPQK